jgi:alkyl hydroperoxide reductase subunit AhpF
MSILKIYQGQALQQALAEIVSPVEVIYFAIDQPEPDTVAALADLMALTAYLSVTTTPAGPNAPADRVIVRSQAGRELVFVGAPLGLELAALVSAIIVAGRGDSGLLPETRQALARLQTPVHLEVFTTPT